MGTWELNSLCHSCSNSAPHCHLCSTTLHHGQGKEHLRLLQPVRHPAVQGGFGIMDINKNGILEADDLVQAFTNVGKSVSAGEAQAMLDETTAPVNFTKMVLLFADKMAGGSDDDDVILKSFEAFEMDGKIDAE